MFSQIDIQEQTRCEIISKYPTEEHLLTYADHISLEEFRSLGESMPKFAQGLFDEPSTVGGRRKRKRLSEFTEQEKHARRKLKNRVAAQAARDRKRIKNENQVNDLEAAKMEILQLKKENRQLREENSSLRAENMQFRNERIGSNGQFHQQIFSQSSPVIVSNTSSSPTMSTSSNLQRPNNSFQNISNVTTTMTPGVPLITSRATTSAERQPSFRAGTLRSTLSDTENNLELKKEVQKTEDIQVGEVGSEGNTALDFNMMKMYSMLVLQVILSKAGTVIRKLNDTPEKQLQRRLNYAYLMEDIDQNKKSPSSSTINRTLTAIRPRFLPNNSVETKQMKLTTFSTLSHLPPKKRRTRNMSSQSSNSSLSNQISSMPNSNQSAKKLEAPSQIWPQSSQQETFWLKNSSGTSLASHCQTWSNKTVKCPVHGNLLTRDPACLVCRRSPAMKVQIKPQFLNKLNAADLILRKVYTSRKNYQTMKLNQEKIQKLKNWLKNQVKEGTVDPQNLRIEAVLKNGSSKDIIDTAKEVRLAQKQIS